MTQDNTLPTLTSKRCRELMPEWKGLDLKINILTGGITNKLYRVQTSDGGDYVVRVYGQNTELFIDRDVEMENIRLMESSGVTTKLIKYLPHEKVTIVGFVPGKSFNNDDFQNEELLEDLVRPIKRIHNCPVKLPRIFDPCKEVKKLFDILQEVGKKYPEFDIAGTVDILQNISDLAAIDHAEYVPCHNDLLADNFIMVADPQKYNEKVFLIDWEYAGMNTVYYELADMFQEILVPRAIEEKILGIYWEDKKMDEHLQKTDMFKPFPDIYWFLWSLIQLSVSNIEFDYYNYGKVKYENARNNIQVLRDNYQLNI